MSRKAALFSYPMVRFEGSLKPNTKRLRRCIIVGTFHLFHSAFKMRLIMSQWSHGETTTNRQSIGGESTASRCPYHRAGTTARRASGAAPGLGVGNPRANGGHP